MKANEKWIIPQGREFTTGDYLRINESEMLEEYNASVGIYGDPEKIQSTIALIICFLRDIQNKDLDITTISGYHKLIELQRLVLSDYYDMICESKASYLIF